jgi:hypothetical protein
VFSAIRKAPQTEASHFIPEEPPGLPATAPTATHAGSAAVSTTHPLLG